MGAIINVKPDRIFNNGDVVNTPSGVRVVVSSDGYAVIDGLWVPMYFCVPMNKKGEPDKRITKSRWRKMSNSFLETQISKA